MTIYRILNCISMKWLFLGEGWLLLILSLQTSKEESGGIMGDFYSYGFEEIFHIKKYKRSK